MKKTGWVVQTNLGKESDVEEIRLACETYGIDYYPVVSIPFSDDLPDVPTDQPLQFYGSCNFIKKIEESGRWNLGQNPDDFDVACWTAKYGGLALNCDASNHRLKDAHKFFEAYDFDFDHVFLKPASNGKAFAGQVFDREELAKWVAEVESDPDLPFDTNLEVSVSRPKNIQTEWRMFMVDGIGISCSIYKSHGRPKMVMEYGRVVHEFCELVDRVWRPADCYALDVCLAENKLYVVEVNDLSSSGFYAHNISGVVRLVSKHIQEKWNTEGITK
jgi:hypothetical protein